MNAALRAHQAHIIRNALVDRARYYANGAVIDAPTATQDDAQAILNAAYWSEYQPALDDALAAVSFGMFPAPSQTRDSPEWREAIDIAKRLTRARTVLNNPVA